MKKWYRMLAAVLAAVLVLSGCSGARSSFQDEVVARIDGEDVYKSELMVYIYSLSQTFEASVGDEVWSMDFDGQSADEVVQERALATLQSVYASKKYVEEHDLKLTDEMVDQAVTAGMNIYNSLGSEEKAKIGLDGISMGNVFIDSFLYALAFDDIAMQYDGDEAEAEAYYEANKEGLLEAYSQYTIRSIMVADQATADEVYARAMAGEDFTALFTEYEMDEEEKQSEEQGVRLFLGAELGVEAAAVFSGVGIGGIAEPFESEGNYFVCRVEAKTAPTEEEMEIIAISEYLNEARNAYAEAQMLAMVEAQDVEIIDEAWGRLEKFHD